MVSCHRFNILHKLRFSPVNLRAGSLDVDTSGASETNYACEASSSPLTTTVHTFPANYLHLVVEQRSRTDSCGLLILLEDANCAGKEQTRGSLAEYIWESPRPSGCKHIYTTWCRISSKTCTISVFIVVYIILSSFSIFRINKV